MFQCFNCDKNIIKPDLTINFDNIIYNEEYIDIPPEYNSSSLWIITSPHLYSNTKQYQHCSLLSQLTGEENSYFLQFPCIGNEHNNSRLSNSCETSSRQKTKEVTVKKYTSLNVNKDLTKMKKYLMDNSF